MPVRLYKQCTKSPSHDCQTALRRTGTRPSLFGPLHPSRCHLQPSPALRQRLHREFSLEGRQLDASDGNSVTDSLVTVAYIRRRTGVGDYAQQSKARIMTLSSEEFLRRFLQHVGCIVLGLPFGNDVIISVGWLNRSRKNLLPLCRLLLHQPLPASGAVFPNRSTWQCPLCHGPMYIIERLSAAQIFLIKTRSSSAYNTS